MFSTPTMEHGVTWCGPLAKRSDIRAPGAGPGRVALGGTVADVLVADVLVEFDLPRGSAAQRGRRAVR